MRIALALAFLAASPALAWEATIDVTCTLTHETDQAEIRLTYDPAQPLYTITVTRKDAPWVPAQVFGMTFDGPAPNTISTPRHQLNADNSSVGVADRGFGNVLDGLQFNDTATAFLGEQSVTVDLSGAAPEVQAFRECRPVPLA